MTSSDDDKPPIDPLPRGFFENVGVLRNGGRAPSSEVSKRRAKSLQNKRIAAKAKLLEAENKRLRIEIAERERDRLLEERERAKRSAEGILTPDDVMRMLSGLARETSDIKVCAQVLCKLADVYTLSKRDHGEEERAERMRRLASASDEELDAALNRGVGGR
jgi:hypothetical protein